MSLHRVARVASAWIALALLGAHFWRGQAWIGVVLCALPMPLVLIRDRPWALRTVQAALLIGTLEWLRTAFVLAQERLALGAPWVRMAIILGAVALFTAANAWMLARRR